MIAILLLLAIVTILVHNFYLKRRCYPPGPTPLPVFGNMIALLQQPPGYEVFKSWAKQYGPVYTMWLGNQAGIVITDYQIMKEALTIQGSKYAGRPYNPMDEELRKGKYGLISSTGDLWSQHRRFVLKVLRDFGFGKNLMEERIMCEVVPLLEKIRKESENGPIDLMDTFDASVGSVINNLLFGYRFDETNMNDFLQLKAKMAVYMGSVAHPIVIVLMLNPKLKHLPLFKQKYQSLASVFEDLQSFFRKQLHNHREEIDFDNEDSTDFVEAYLKEQKKYENEANFGGFTEIQLLNTLSDLWVAGMETTSNTLYWSILYILHNPHVLIKLHEELDSIVGNDRVVDGSDKPKLHYVNAVIAELQRVCNLVPMNIPHMLTDDVILTGFEIKKGTIVVPQISSVLADDKIFPEPYKFDPNRHLDANGCFVKHDEMIPFSMGKRSCLGEGLARAELFLFLSNIFHAFDFAPLDPNNLPSLEKSFGATIKAKNYQLRMKSRF